MKRICRIASRRPDLASVLPCRVALPLPTAQAVPSSPTAFGHVVWVGLRLPPSAPAMARVSGSSSQVGRGEWICSIGSRQPNRAAPTSRVRLPCRASRRASSRQLLSPLVSV